MEITCSRGAKDAPAGGLPPPPPPVTAAAAAAGLPPSLLAALTLLLCRSFKAGLLVSSGAVSCISVPAVTPRVPPRVSSRAICPFFSCLFPACCPITHPTAWV